MVPTKWPKRSSWAASSGPGPSMAMRPGPQHVAPVGDLEGPAGVLLDDEDGVGLARAGRQSRSNITSTITGARPKRRLVEQHDARVAHQSPGHGQLLGLAARQVSGRASFHRLSSAVNRCRASSSRRRRSARRRRDAGQLQVLADGQVAEDAPPFRDQGEARPDELGPARPR